MVSKVLDTVLTTDQATLNTTPEILIAEPDGFPDSALAQLLEQADIVTLHVNLDPATRRMFSHEQFGRMKRGSNLVNTSRGELVDESALLDALRSGHLRGAALDVLTDEDANGMCDHRLVCYARNHDNLIITPHVGGCTVESLQKAEEFLAARLCARLSQSPLSSPCLRDA